MPIPGPGTGTADDYPIVMFMSAPDVAATVRFDCNVRSSTDRVHVLPDFDPGVPQLEGEPDGVSVEYGLRTLSFTLRIEGPKATALATQSALARELLRTENWLYVQLSDDVAPVWFRLYRAEPGALSFAEVYDIDSLHDVWDISMSLPAASFAYGERVTLGAVTVNNNPAHVTNPCSYTLATVLGDAPTPCRIQINPSNAAAMAGFRWMIAHAALDAAYTAVFWQVGASDGWTAGTDTGASAADVDYSNGSYRAVTFATPTMATRLSGSAPSTPTRGRYKVLVRIARSDTTSKFSMRFGQNVGAAYIYGDTVVMDRASSTATEHATWVDLGDFTFPRGVGQVPDSLTATVPTPSVSLQMARDSGSGSAYIDCFALIPVDIKGQTQSSVLFSEFTRVGIDTSGGLGVWDGDEEAFWAFNSSAGLFTPMPEIRGGYPQLVPGATNKLHVLQQVMGGKPFFNEDASDDISVSASLVVSYYPRWLWIGEG